MTFEEIIADREVLMLRSVSAMAIAEGDEGYEKLSIDCPMLEAVLTLRENYNLAHKELGIAIDRNGDLQNEIRKLQTYLKVGVNVSCISN